MSEPVTLELVEQTEWVGVLGDADYQFLADQLIRQFTLRREIRHGQPITVLNPNQYVGTVVLPSGLQLRVKPKVPVRNLVYMISRAYRLWPFREEEVKFELIEEILALFARLFAEMVETKLEEGLYRSYVEREESVAFIRGGILFGEDLKRNLLRRQYTHCRFTEFTWDIEENQILRQVGRFLAGWNFSSDLRTRLARLDAEMAEITPTHLPSAVISRFRYNRFNEGYKPLHQLCYLLLEGASLSEELGLWDGRAFLIDMNKLFEEFITQLLIDVAGNGVTVLRQETITLDEEGRVTMRPDLLLSEWGVTRLAADCKYKRLELDEYKNVDFYQLLSYCIACNIHRGLLIYPEHVMNSTAPLQIRNVPVTMAQRTINLGLSFPLFKEECQRFADGLIGLVSEPATFVPTP